MALISLPHQPCPREMVRATSLAVFSFWLKHVPPQLLGAQADLKQLSLVLNEPTDLPEGDEVLLELAEQGDDLDDEDRARLHAALERSVAQAQVGKLVPAATVTSKLRPDL